MNESSVSEKLKSVPRDPAFESTLSVLKEGYEFISNRCRRFHSDVFELRVLGKRAACIHGREAARLFYDESRFQRTGALPRRIITSLFGKGAVHTLDGSAHQQRKQAFVSLMAPERLASLMEITARQWRRSIRQWQERRSLVLFDEVELLLTRAICEWCGVPLQERDVSRRASDLGRMVDAFGGVGPRLWRGKIARARAERWVIRIIEDVRNGRLNVSRDAPLAVMAGLTDVDGRVLPARLAAVELLNVIRPTVAIAWYITFSALALHEHPEARSKLSGAPLEGGPGSYAELFMQEVRRYYPFAPFLGARAQANFEWRGCAFKKGQLVLLDVYGTNHDTDIWGDPGVFRPERFAAWKGDSFDFIPQGGGQLKGHRCPGEWITMHNMILALHFLTRGMTYRVPAQDLTIDLTRMPTKPRSGFAIRDVRATQELDEDHPPLPDVAVANASLGAMRTEELSPTALRG